LQFSFGWCLTKRSHYCAEFFGGDAAYFIVILAAV
jgi:hypothetical protein